MYGSNFLWSNVVLVHVNENSVLFVLFPFRNSSRKDTHPAELQKVCATKLFRVFIKELYQLRVDVGMLNTVEIY